MRTLRLVLTAALLTPAVGCSWMKDNMTMGSRPPKGTGKLPDVTANQLVDYLNQRADQLHQLNYNDVHLRCYDRGLPMPMLDGNLAAAQPRSCRLVVGKAGVNAKVDLGSNPEMFWIYVQVPTEKPVYYYASHTDFESGRAKLPGGIPFEPDWVMQALGMTRFKDPQTTQYLVTPNDKDRTYTLSWPSTTPGGLAVTKKVIFDGDAATGTRPQVKRHVVEDAKTKKVLCYADIKSVKTYQLPLTDPNGTTGIQYPTNVVLKWEEQKFEMDLSLENAQVNQPYPEGDARRLFSRPDIRGASPIDLAGGFPR